VAGEVTGGRKPLISRNHRGLASRNSSRDIISRNSSRVISAGPYYGPRPAEPPPEENRIPPVERLQGKALVSESRRAFSGEKWEKFDRSAAGETPRDRPFQPPSGSRPAFRLGPHCRITLMTLSGFREMESMPAETRNSAKSG